MTEQAKEKVLFEIKRACAIYERYKVSSTFAILCHKQPIGVSELGPYLRVSDKLLKIDDNHYFINFALSEEEGALKGCQNLLHSLDKHFNTTDAYIAMTAFDESHTPNSIYTRLIQILTQMQKNYNSRIEDETILSSLV